MQKLALIAVTLAFTALTVMALIHHGYWGIIEPHFQTWGAGQVFADLVIALGLFLIWMWRDAKTLGRNPVGWTVITLFLGSFGPLLYLLTRKTDRASASSQSVQPQAQ